MFISLILRSCPGAAMVTTPAERSVLLLTELLQKSEDVMRIICPVFMSLFTHLSQLEETSYHQCVVGNTSEDSVWGFPDVACRIACCHTLVHRALHRKDAFAIINSMHTYLEKQEWPRITKTSSTGISWYFHWCYQQRFAISRWYTQLRVQFRNT